MTTFTLEEIIEDIAIGDKETVGSCMTPYYARAIAKALVFLIEDGLTEGEGA